MQNKKTDECLICKAPLEYLQKQQIMECELCHKKFMSNTRCQNGHFICDACHQKMGLYVIEKICNKSASKNPITIMQEIIKSPHIHMHGPEHHVLVGSVLLTAYKNAGGDIDLKNSLIEMRNRGSKIPGGVCGLWGACGAGISTGIFISLITKTTPLSSKTWGLSNKMTSKSIAVISEHGGPRCCKRDSYLAILTAIDFVKNNFKIEMEIPEKIKCNLSYKNRQCIGNKCPFYIKNK